MTTENQKQQQQDRKKLHQATVHSMFERHKALDPELVVVISMHGTQCVVDNSGGRITDLLFMHRCLGLEIDRIMGVWSGQRPGET